MLLFTILSLGLRQLPPQDCMSRSDTVKPIRLREAASSVEILASSGFVVARHASGAQVLYSLDGTFRGPAPTEMQYGGRGPGDRWTSPVPDAGAILYEVGADGGLRTLGPPPCWGLSEVCVGPLRLSTNGRRLFVGMPDGTSALLRLHEPARFEASSSSTSILVSPTDFQALARRPELREFLIPQPPFAVLSYSCTDSACWSMSQKGDVARFDRVDGSWVVVGTVRPGFTSSMVSLGGNHSQGLVYDRRCPFHVFLLTLPSSVQPATK